MLLLSLLVRHLGTAHIRYWRTKCRTEYFGIRRGRKNVLEETIQLGT
jgi:hypothetical protein